jgi:hypothetical protein
LEPLLPPPCCRRQPTPDWVSTVGEHISASLIILLIWPLKGNQYHHERNYVSSLCRDSWTVPYLSYSHQQLVGFLVPFLLLFCRRQQLVGFLSPSHCQYNYLVDFRLLLVEKTLPPKSSINLATPMGCIAKTTEFQVTPRPAINFLQVTLCLAHELMQTFAFFQCFFGVTECLSSGRVATSGDTIFRLFRTLSTNLADTDQSSAQWRVCGNPIQTCPSSSDESTFV